MAAEYARACRQSIPREEAEIAKPLQDAVRGNGFPIIDDGGEIVRPGDFDLLRDFIGILYSLPQEILRKYPGDQRTYGFVDRGEESYVVDSLKVPEVWKRGFYLSKVWKDGELGLPLEGIPWGADLDSLSQPDRKFYEEFVQQDYLRLDSSLHHLATLVNNAVGKYCLGLESGHFDGAFFQGHNNRGFGVGRLLQYVRDQGAKVGDIIAGPHEDTFPSALVKTLWGNTPISSLEALLPDGTYAAIAYGGKNRYSWNFGWSLFIYALHKHHVDRNKIEEIMETRDLSLVPEHLREKVGFPTTHRVIRRDNPDNPLPPTLAKEEQERLSLAFFSGMEPRTWLGTGTFQKVTNRDFSRYVE